MRINSGINTRELEFSIKARRGREKAGAYARQSKEEGGLRTSLRFGV